MLVKFFDVVHFYSFKLRSICFTQTLPAHITRLVPDVMDVAEVNCVPFGLHDRIATFRTIMHVDIPEVGVFNFGLLYHSTFRTLDRDGMEGRLLRFGE
jgi:hypothetical protein